MIAEEKQQKEEKKNFLTILNAKEKHKKEKTTNEFYTILKSKKKNCQILLKCFKRETIILSDPYSKSLKNFKAECILSEKATF